MAKDLKNSSAKPNGLGRLPVPELALDPERPIVDPHQHLWDHPAGPSLITGRWRFLLDEFLQTINDSAHNVVQTVYVECNSMYRSDGPAELRSLGETEFATGMAAMSASNRYGERRVATGIVAMANLRLGAEVESVLESHVAVANSRLKGIRCPVAWREEGLFGRPADPAMKGILLERKFQEGVRTLDRFGLSLDVWCLQSQIAELAKLATKCPDTLIVLDHLGTPAKGNGAFASWKRDIDDLALRPNVVVKLGGLGMDISAPITGMRGTATSEHLWARWQLYVETCIEAFGVRRCMFESNFPVDRSTCSYGALWNTFKRIVAGYSETEKNALFHDTATRVYRLSLSGGIKPMRSQKRLTTAETSPPKTSEPVPESR